MSEGLFPQHPKSGPWETLKGSKLAPHMTGPIDGGVPEKARHQTGSVVTSHWDSNVLVSTGKTGGGGTMAK